MGLFSCKVCQEKDKRIAELKDQIAHLRLLVYPVNDALVPVEDDVVVAEATQDPEVQQFQEQQLAELEEVMSERDRLLSGQY